jgi:hypothetical protein
MNKYLLSYFFLKSLEILDLFDFIVLIFSSDIHFLIASFFNFSKCSSKILVAFLLDLKKKSAISHIIGTVQINVSIA